MYVFASLRAQTCVKDFLTEGQTCTLFFLFFFSANPKCEKAGCGEWKPPVIDNPAYKGKWSPPLVDNANYKVSTTWINSYFLISMSIWREADRL